MWKTFYENRSTSNAEKLKTVSATMPDMIPGLKKLIKFDTARMNAYHDQAKEVSHKLKDVLQRDQRLDAHLEDEVDRLVIKLTKMKLRVEMMKRDSQNKIRQFTEDDAAIVAVLESDVALDKRREMQEKEEQRKIQNSENETQNSLASETEMHDVKKMVGKMMLSQTAPKKNTKKSSNKKDTLKILEKSLENMTSHKNATDKSKNSKPEQSKKLAKKVFLAAKKNPKDKTKTAPKSKGSSKRADERKKKKDAASKKRTLRRSKRAEKRTNGIGKRLTSTENKTKKSLALLKTNIKKERMSTTKANHFERLEARTQRSVNRNVKHLNKFQTRIHSLLEKYKKDAEKAAGILGKSGMLTKNQQFVEKSNKALEAIKTQTENAITQVKSSKRKIDAGTVQALMVGHDEDMKSTMEKVKKLEHSMGKYENQLDALSLIAQKGKKSQAPKKSQKKSKVDDDVKVDEILSSLGQQLV